MHLKTAFFICCTVNCIFIYIEWKGGTWGCKYARFYEQWKFYSCLLEEVISESRNLFVRLLGMQNVASNLEK